MVGRKLGGRINSKEHRLESYSVNALYLTNSCIFMQKGHLCMSGRVWSLAVEKNTLSIGKITELKMCFVKKIKLTSLKLNELFPQSDPWSVHWPLHHDNIIDLIRELKWKQKNERYGCLVLLLVKVLLRLRNGMFHKRRAQQPVSTWNWVMWSYYTCCIVCVGSFIPTSHPAQHEVGSQNWTYKW